MCGNPITAGDRLLQWFSGCKVKHPADGSDSYHVYCRARYRTADHGWTDYLRARGQLPHLGASLPGFPVPTPFIVAVVVVALTSLLLKKTALGMYIQSVGINKRASQLVGIKSVMIIFLTYAYCGLCSGLSGLIASSRIYSADANNIGLNMELDAILAVAIGGNSLGGGKFSLAGSIIGAYTIQAPDRTTLYAMHVSSDQVPVYKAIVVVIIVALQSPGFARWRISGTEKRTGRGRKGGGINHERKEEIKSEHVPASCHDPTVLCDVRDRLRAL